MRDDGRAVQDAADAVERRIVLPTRRVVQIATDDGDLAQGGEPGFGAQRVGVAGQADRRQVRERGLRA